MEFRLLGPVELWSDGRQIDLGTTKIRLLLAVLLLEAGRTVPVQTLVDRVWGDEAPARVGSSVQANLSRLRRRLEQARDDRLRLEYQSSTGYRLLVAAEDVDALEFTRTISEGQAAAAQGERERAIRLLQTAQTMVRGEPLSGLPGEWAESARTGLQDRLRAAMVTRIGLQLERDDPHTLIAEVRELASRYQLDEAITGLLMRVLQAAGRRTDALAVFQTARRRIVDRFALEPGRALRDLHQQILHGVDVAPRRTQSLSTAPVALPSPNTLERELPGFVGRQRDLDTLRHEVARQLEVGQTAVCVIDGMPGVGKSSLALALAHELRPQCPDGALELHLRGHDPQHPPTTAEEALRLLLGMLHVETRELERSAGLDRLLSLWRRCTHGRRLLLLLDDASDAEQIRPLVPAGSGSVVLVTCRRQTTDLRGTIRHTLPLMRLQDARELFISTAEVEAPEDTAAIDAIVKTCGRLPIALSIAGAQLRARRSWTISEFAERLARSLAAQGIDTLTERLNAAFDTSYRDLPELPRLVLRRLALHPGVRISAHFAAALAGVELYDTEFALDTLVSHNLLAETRFGQYQLHDIVKRFAAYRQRRDDLPTEAVGARGRLLEAALQAADEAMVGFHPYRHVNLVPTTRGRQRFPEFSTARKAGEWLDAQQEPLRLLISEAYGEGCGRQAAALSHMLAPYFDRRGYWHESVPIHEQALHTWVRLDDALGQAYALGDLATVQWRLGNFDQAIVSSETALTIWSHLGNRDGQADALLQLGRTRYVTHRFEDAIRCYRQAAALRASLSNEHGEAQALYLLGVALFESGCCDEGIADVRRALKLAREAHDESIERNCLNNLGEFSRKRGDYNQALDYYQQSMVVAERVGDPWNIAVAALNLGEIHRVVGRPREALAFLDRAQETFTRLGTLFNSVSALLAKIRAHLQLSEMTKAAELLEQATAVTGATPDPVLAARIHLTGGQLYMRQGDHAAAIAEYRSALARARQAHAILERAQAHSGIADVLVATGRRALAVPHWRKALELYAPMQASEAEALRLRLGETSTAEASNPGGGT